MTTPSKEALSAAETLRDESMNYQWISHLGIYEAAPVEAIATLIDTAFAEKIKKLSGGLQMALALAADIEELGLDRQVPGWKGTINQLHTALKEPPHEPVA